VAGRVAFITGAARGQGRSHAVRLAAEGADIIAVDLCAQVSSVPYPLATPADLAGTVKEVEALDRRIIATQADVRGGSVVLTSSTAGLMPLPGLAHYVSAKHGVVGLMRTLAAELAPHFIRVNSVHPTTVNTPMVDNEQTRALFLGGADEPSDEAFAAAIGTLNLLPVPWVEAVDVSNAVLFLASDEARYITGVTLPVDAGSTIK
jgi:NAD(P)-dependent dehydrogenase (short-subunit alcohol dehydrogenase family)